MEASLHSGQKICFSRSRHVLTVIPLSLCHLLNTHASHMGQNTNRKKEEYCTLDNHLLLINSYVLWYFIASQNPLLKKKEKSKTTILFVCNKQLNNHSKITLGHSILPIRIVTDITEILVEKDWFSYPKNSVCAQKQPPL